MTKSFEIYFTDLTKSAQKEYLKFIGATDESEINVDIIPLAIVEKEEVDEKEEEK